MKRKALALVLALVLGICALSACSDNSSPPTPAAFSDSLFSFIEKEYPNNYMERDGIPGEDGYIGYVLNAGVICYTEQNDSGALTKAGVTIDMSLANGDALSSGAGCLYLMIDTIDSKQADSIAKTLGLDSIPTGSTTAKGSSGEYTFGAASNSILLMWEANNVAQ